MDAVQSETRRRKREKTAVIIITCALLVLTGVEVHLLRLSAKLPFVNSIFFFGLMNVNLVLIMLLLFLVFRNAVKLILDERRGRLGSRLKTRLVVSFLLFAIIPTLFLFTISAFYIKSSFDKWFNIKVGGTLQRSIEVVQDYYNSNERSASHFARKIGLSLTSIPRDPSALQKRLQNARLEYGLDAVEHYPTLVGQRSLAVSPERGQWVPLVPIETLRRLFEGKNECSVSHVGDGELVRCGVFLGINRGALFASLFIPLGLSSQLSEISLTYDDYRKDNPLNYPIKSTYFAILLMVTLLILFSATWTGFYVAKRLTVPIEELVRGTEAVAQGNLDYVIPLSGSDEMAKLIESFNQMTGDLKESDAHLKQTNDELERRRRYIEVLIESVQSGVISLDEAGRISMVNQAAQRLLGRSAADLIGQPYTTLTTEPHRSELEDLLQSIGQSSQPVRRELRIRNSGGEWITLLVTLSALRNDQRKNIGMVAVLDNITEIQKMERMMAWREVAKRIAHEIKNPLTPIALSVQRLRRRYLDKISDDGAFGEATEIILKEVDSLKTLVNEFSSFARLPETTLRTADLNQIVVEAANLFRSAHETIFFALELQGELPPMELDKDQIKRVLVNLFDNAVAAMGGRDGKIAVTTQYDKSNGLVRLSVCDDGSGISPEAASQLFEPYFSTKEGGTGLGLAIVQKIITDHGGVVRVAPNVPAGTKFVIEFPQTVLVGSRRPLVSERELS